jgi:hypothetical protein
MRLGIKYCEQCEPNAEKARIEHTVRDMLLPMVDIPPSAIDNTHFGGTQCGAADSKIYRPDLLYADQRLVLDIEIDEEGGHPREDPSCHVARMCALTSIFQKESMFGAESHVYFIRFNPDEYADETTSLDDRVAVLATRIAELRANPPAPSGVPSVEYLFYRPSCLKHAEFAKANGDAVRVISQK